MILYFQENVKEVEGEEAKTLLRKGWSIQDDPPDVKDNEISFWNRETQKWEIREKNQITAEWLPLDFLLRFTADERAEMTLKSRDNYVVSDFRILCASARSIRADHPLTIQGMNFLKSIGVLSQERIDQILDPNWNPDSVN